jgi:hypothetical protein
MFERGGGPQGISITCSIELTHTHLQRVADVDEEGVAVGGHGYPLPAVAQRDLQAGRAVGAQHGDELRVGVLAEPRGAAAQALQLRAGRVVVHAEHLVAALLRHHRAQRVQGRNSQTLRHRLQHAHRHVPHTRDVPVQRVPATSAPAYIIRTWRG